MRVFRCYGTRSRTAGSRRTVTGKSGLPELALLLSLLWHFVAVALGRARQAAGETLISKSGLPELAPLLSARSPVSPVASPSSSRTVVSCHCQPSTPCILVHRRRPCLLEVNFPQPACWSVLSKGAFPISSCACLGTLLHGSLHSVLARFASFKALHPS